jgi:hypothetical protein
VKRNNVEDLHDDLDHGNIEVLSLYCSNMNFTFTIAINIENFGFYFTLR